MSREVATKTGQPSPKRAWKWWTREPEKLIKLQDAYTADATDEMAMVYAGVTRSQLYYYQKLHPEFSEWKKVLKNNPTVQAKYNVIKAIKEGKVAESQWWLERRAKEEFSPRHESMNLNLNADLELDERKKEELQRILDNNA